MTTPQSPQQGNQPYPITYDQHAGYAEQPGQIPPQWTPPGYPLPPAGWPAPQVVAAPRNGLGITALCLGIVGILFGLVPLTGFVAFALGAVGVILGLVGLARARKRVATNRKTAISGTALSVIAIGLGIWGMVTFFTSLNQLATALKNIPSASAPAAPGSVSLPGDVNTPAPTAGPHSYQLEVTGTAKKIMLSYGTESAMSSSSGYQGLPWRKTVETNGDYGMATVSASSSGPGSITCTVTDTATGQVVNTKTSKSLDDSQYASANVSCNSRGY